MTPWGVILLTFFLPHRSLTNDLISQNIVQFHPSAESSISSLIYPHEAFNSTAESSDGERVKRHNQYNTYFNNFIDQRVHGNRIPQCPCVINPGSNRCIAYDSRYQAASVEEAIVSFPDFTTEDNPPGTLDENTFLCRTLECQACAKLMIERLKAIGFIPWNAQLSIYIPPDIDTRYCTRLGFTKPRRKFNPPSVISSEMRAIIREGQRRAGLLGKEQTAVPQQTPNLVPAQVGTASDVAAGQYPQSPPQWSRGDEGSQPWNGYAQRPQPITLQPYQASYPQAPQVSSSSYPSGPPVTWAGGGSPFASFQRAKRQAMGDRILGNRFVIDCIARGESESEDSDFLSLCGACWTWRQLPSDYFPRLLNEFVCKQGADGYCLSGWGECEQKFRNLDVLRRVRGEWVPTTISTASCCNCRVKAGTEIHALVVGRG